MFKRIFLTLACYVGCGFAVAQSDIITTGGEATGNGGIVSYTIGQIAVQQTDNQNVSISEGVQQPYEIQTIGVDNYPNIVLDAMVYPNPTANRLTLKINDVETFHETSLRATLHNTNGQYICSLDVTIPQTDIDMTALSAGTYFLRVTDGQTTLKTFKVVKTM